MSNDVRAAPLIGAGTLVVADFEVTFVLCLPGNRRVQKPCGTLEPLTTNVTRARETFAGACEKCLAGEYLI